MNASKRHFLDWFFLLRPTLLFPVCTVFLAGYRLGDRQLGFFEWAIFSLCSIALGGAVYVLNETFDVDSDRDNEKLHYLQSGIFSITEARGYGIALAVFGLVGLAFVAWHAVLWVAGGFLLTAVLYNVPPFRWKDKPIAGIVVAALSGALIFWAGLLFSGAKMGMFVQAFPYVLAFAGVSLLTQLLDAKGDVVHEKRTFAVTHGVPTTINVAALLIGLSAIFSLALGELPLTIAALATATMLPKLLREKSASFGALVARVAIAGLSLMIGLHFPVYLATMIAYYFFARWYYQFRFDMNYPSLTGTTW